MATQTNSWADEQVEAIADAEMMRSATTERRVRQRKRRGSKSLPSSAVHGHGHDARVCKSSNATIAMRAEETHTRPLPVLRELQVNTQCCNEVLARLDHGDPDERHRIVLGLCPGIHQLALAKAGCHIIQGVIEMAEVQDRDLIIVELSDHIIELCESPHGNYVLQKAIKVWPIAKCNFIISGLFGQAILACKHKYSCRVVQRLMEHCEECKIRPLLDEIVTEADQLARSDFGNFVLQTALEHMSPAFRSAVLAQVLPRFANVAMLRNGSRVAQRLLEFCCSDGQYLAIRALLQAEGESSLVEVACSHYGCYVIEQLAGLKQSHSGALEAVSSILASNLQQLQASPHAQRVIKAFGLGPSEQLAPAS